MICLHFVQLLVSIQLFTSPMNYSTPGLFVPYYLPRVCPIQENFKFLDYDINDRQRNFHIRKLLYTTSPLFELTQK